MSEELLKDIVYYVFITAAFLLLWWADRKLPIFSRKVRQQELEFKHRVKEYFGAVGGPAYLAGNVSSKKAMAVLAYIGLVLIRAVPSIIPGVVCLSVAGMYAVMSFVKR